MQFNTKIRISLILIVLLALGLRLYKWDEKFLFNAEYNYKLWPMQNIIENKKIPMIGIEAVSYLHHVHYPPFFLYIFTPILRLFNYNPVTIEMVFICLSGLISYLFFLLGKNIYDIYFGLLLAFLYAISYFTQQADKFIWVVGGIYFICVLFMYLLYKSLHLKKLYFIEGLYLGLTISFGLNLHYQAMLLLMSLIFLCFVKDFRKKISVKFFIGITVGLIIFIFPILIFELRHNFYNLKGILMLLQYQNNSAPVLERFINAINLVAGLFMAIFLPDNVSTHNILPLMFSLPVLITIGIIIKSLFNKTNTDSQKQLFIIFIFFLILNGIIMYTFLKNQFTYYLFILQPVLLTITAIFCRYCWNKNNYRYPVLLILSAIICVNLYKDFTLTSTLTYTQQLNTINKFYKNSKQYKLSLYFPQFPSEEYAFLIYYVARNNQFDYKNIEIYEPWQQQNHAEYELRIIPISGLLSDNKNQLVIQKR